MPNAQCPVPATRAAEAAESSNYRTFVHAFPVDRGFMAMQGKRLRNYLHWPMAPSRGQHREMQSFMFQDLRLLERSDFRINTIYSALPDTQYNVVAYTLDQAGRIRLATDYGIHGDGNKAFQCTNLDVDDWDLNVPVSLFECGTVELFGLVDTQRYNPNLEVFGDNYQGYASSHADRGYAPHLKITGVKDVESHTDLERYGFTQYGPTAMVFLPADSIVGAEILLGSYFTNFTVLGQGSDIGLSGIGLSGTGHLALGISGVGLVDVPASSSHPFSASRSTAPEALMPNAQCPMPSQPPRAPAGFKLASGQHVRLAGGEGFGPRLFSQQLSDLDHRRLSEFAQHDVASPKANRYARDSAQVLDAAQLAQERRDWKAAAGQYQRGWTFQSEAYRNIVTLLLDVVSTTVLYFVLLIPFSVLLERLVFPQRTPLRTVLVAAIIFAVFAGLLYMFHPGFKLANNVIVTTTAFVIVVMTLPALLLLLWRGVAMLRAIGSKAIITTQSEAESAGVVMAALSLAVSNMRRRKLRTGLTLATITLLVVALVLLTTSSAFDFKIMEPTQAGQASAEGIQIMNARDHRMPLLKEMVEQYEGVLADAGTGHLALGISSRGESAGPVSGPRGLATGTTTMPTPLMPNAQCPMPPLVIIRREWVNYGYDHKSDNGHIRLAANGRSVPLPYFQIMDWRDGLVPYTLVEGKNRRALRLPDLVQGAFLAEGDVDACLLPNTLAEAIGAKVGDTVTAMGLPLRVKGIWEARRTIIQADGTTAYIPGALDRLTDLDGLPITAFAGAKHREGMPETPVHASSTEFVIVPRAWLEKHAVFTSCVSSLLVVRPEGWSPDQLTDLAARLAREILNVDVYVHFIDERGQSVSRKISMSTATHVQGSSLMLVVMGAAVLMILAIMTGTVYERMREIHIFSSVGLSPRHVAGMFLIEALVYAGVAAVLGYFIGIIALKWLLWYLKSTGQHQDFYPNYLGVFVIYSTGMAVLATVASSLYPIRLASKIVNPGGAGAWKLEPAGRRDDEDSPELDEWLVRLPFIATTQDEARGIMVYAADYLAIHQGERSGRFVCERPPAGTAEALPEKPHRDARMSLFMPVWLAPFERNLSQTAELYAQPTADGAWWDMFLKLRRVSGPGYLWRRGATVFVNMLCKHLLRWRAATPQQETDCVARFVDVFVRQAGKP